MLMQTMPLPQPTEADDDARLARLAAMADVAAFEQLYR